VWFIYIGGFHLQMKQSLSLSLKRNIFVWLTPLSLDSLEDSILCFAWQHSSHTRYLTSPLALIFLEIRITILNKSYLPISLWPYQWLSVICNRHQSFLRQNQTSSIAPLPQSLALFHIFHLVAVDKFMTKTISFKLICPPWRRSWRNVETLLASAT